MYDRIKAALQKDVLKSATIGVVSIILILLLLILFKPARADITPYVYMGLETDVNHSMICKPGSVNDLAANMGFGATLYSWNMLNMPFDLNIQYSHLSCVASPDWDTYDGVGAMLRWYPWGR